MFVVIHFYFLTFILIRSVKKNIFATCVTTYCWNTSWLLTSWLLLSGSGVPWVWRGLKLCCTLWGTCQSSQLQCHHQQSLPLVYPKLFPMKVAGWSLMMSFHLPWHHLQLSFGNFQLHRLPLPDPQPLPLRPFQRCNTCFCSTILRCGAVVVGRTDLTGNDAGSLSGTELNLGRWDFVVSMCHSARTGGTWD